LVNGISYYWNSIAIGALKAGADWTVANIINNAKDITNGAFNRWTSFSSDTCSTQRKIWALLHTKEEAAHVLSVPCNSHGIQLIFKDLLFPGKNLFQNVIKTKAGMFFKAFSNKIISAFSSSNKQLAYL